MPRVGTRGDHCLGRSRAGFGSKLHVRTDQTGKLITWTLTARQAGERSQVETLLDQREIGRRRHIGAVIPRFSTECTQGVRFDRTAYRTRNVVERTINRLKQYRGIATRYDKLACPFNAGITLVPIVMFGL